jgi:DNA topoisomerase-1
MAVTKLLNEGLPHIMNIGFTALMEENLDKVAQGTVNRNELVFDFYKMFKPELAQLAGNTPVPEETNLTCPQCNQHKLAIRVGKTGAFIGCLGYPDCPFTSNFVRNDDGSVTLVKAPEPELLDETCPQCGKPLRKIVGRYGPFIACSGYPECKYIHVEQASFPCPSCGGTLIKRSWKGKIFWGCKNYPTCKFSISGDIEDKPCPACHESPYRLKKVAKDGTITLVCPRKECGATETIDVA